jgi:hypothetical protein
MPLRVSTLDLRMDQYLVSLRDEENRVNEGT